MAMCYDNCYNLLPKDLLINIVNQLSFQDDYYVFSAVCKSWNSAAAAAGKPWWLPTRIPMLLLAKEVAPGSIIYDTYYDLNQDYGDSDDDAEQELLDYIRVHHTTPPYTRPYDYLKDSVGTSRGIYSLSSMKTYNLELPEAAGKVILSTSKGWLLTLGRDFNCNGCIWRIKLFRFC
nr:PREDICTED: uncharacterized protein LOC108222395 [Daucus carota subsp. sativus]